jgi:hypothetical protein
MSQITIPLSREKLGKLQELAARLGVSPRTLPGLASMTSWSARTRTSPEPWSAS